MRPIVGSRSELRYPFDVLLGTKAQVRILRLLSEDVRPISASEVHQSTGITLNGTLKALDRLQRTGFVTQAGSGRSKTYTLDGSSTLLRAIANVFDAERQWFEGIVGELRQDLRSLGPRIASGWICLDRFTLGAPIELRVMADPAQVTLVRSELRNRLQSTEERTAVRIETSVLTLPDLPFYDDTSIVLLVGYSPFDQTTTEAAGSHRELEQRSLVRSQRFAQLIRRDPSIISRARQHVEQTLRDNPGRTGDDLGEWLRVLDRYSEGQIEHLLVDPGPRATRLRQSSPFPAVLTSEERRFVASGEKDDG